MDEALRQYQQDLLKAQMTAPAVHDDGRAGRDQRVPRGLRSGSSTPSPVASTPARARPRRRRRPHRRSPRRPRCRATSSRAALPVQLVGVLQPDNQEKFKKDFGLSNFTYDTFPSNEELLAKLQAGGKGQYDVAVPTAEFVATLPAVGTWRSSTRAGCRTWRTSTTMFRGLPFDPNDDYIVPKDWGTTGIIYRGKDVKEPVTSWKDFFDLATTKYSGKDARRSTRRVSVRGPAQAPRVRRQHRQSPTSSRSPARSDEAPAHLQSIDSDQYPQTLRDRESRASPSLERHGLLMPAGSREQGHRVTVPSEGTIIWIDTWVLLAGRPHPNIAYAFLDWIQDRSSRSRRASTPGYASANDAAKALSRRTS
jgi:spermidine/putrescine transport system substrate-binding protein